MSSLAIDLITTSGIGTSAFNGPEAPVGSRLMASTTWMPSFTRPNTVYPGFVPASSAVLSSRFTKNCDVAEFGSVVRAAATDPRTLLRPLLDSFGTGGSVGRPRNCRSRPPPWTTKPGITRWNTLPE